MAGSGFRETDTFSINAIQELGKIEAVLGKRRLELKLGDKKSELLGSVRFKFNEE